MAKKIKEQEQKSGWGGPMFPYGKPDKNVKQQYPIPDKFGDQKNWISDPKKTTRQ